jgi:putative DNA primase/helicase
MSGRGKTSLGASAVGNVAVWTSKRGSLSKGIERDGNGGIKKLPPEQTSPDAFEVVEIDGLEALARLHGSLKSTQFLTYGVPARSSGTVMTKKQYAESGEPPNAVTRSKDHVHWPRGPGFMVIDYDPNPAVSPMSREALMAVLGEVIDLEHAGALHSVSSGSCIYDAETREELVGIRGQHVTLMVEDATDIPRAMKVLFKRLWLADHGWILVSAAGSLLPRAPADQALAQPQQPVFEVNANCGPGLVQRRPKPIVDPGGALDTRQALPDLTEEEELEYQALVAEAKRQAMSASRRKRDEWVRGRVAQGVDETDARKTAESLSSGRGALYGTHVLTILEGGKRFDVTVDDVLANPDRYHEVQTLDPIEPEYRGGGQRGIIYTKGCRYPKLHSQAHGGTTYRLGHSADDFSTQPDDFDDVSFAEDDEAAGGGGGRSYSEILADAQEMDANTEPELIEALVAESARLPPIQRQRVATAIKNATGTPIGVIRQAAAAALHAADGGEPDHLTLARSVIDGVGRDNVIGTQSHIWRYRDTGVWRPLEAREERQVAQAHLDAAHRGMKVTKNLIDSVTDVLRTEVYQAEHEWNIGPPDAVVVKNGELVLRDGQWHLEPHQRDFYRTVLVPVEYDPGAAAPRFEQFLQDVFDGDHDAPEKRTAILEMMGYTLMSHAALEKFAILVGSGANGKSVLLAVIEALCGRDNVAGVQPSEFDNKFQRAHLHLRLANIVTEIKEGEVMADAALKSIVSGEPTTVEHKFRDPFEFRPYATCWFGTNHLPHTRDFSEATFRRVVVVPFNRRFELGVDADPQLKGKLLEELPGILNLALDAYAGVLQRGSFTEPETCVDARQMWRVEADQVAQFVDECCTRCNSREPSRDLFLAYENWARSEGIRLQVAHKTLTSRLQQLGFEVGKSGSVRLVKGLRLNRKGIGHKTGFTDDDEDLSDPQGLF